MKSVKIVSSALVISAFLVALGGLAGCEKSEGPAEQAGKEVDEAVEHIGDKMEEAGDKIQDAVKSDK
jgi:hypothetical protein